MTNKKVVIAATAMVVAGVGVFFAYTHKSPQTAAAAEESRRPGVVNPEASDPQMKTERLPAASSERFEPPPPISTGSYTDPKYRKKPDAKSNAR